MALTNAERQKRYRETRKEKVSELDMLRNENQHLKSEVEKLRNEIEELRNNSRSARNKNEKSRACSIDAPQVLISSVFEDDDIWDRPVKKEITIDKNLSMLSVPMPYHQLTHELNPLEDFSRFAPDVWLHSKGQQHWKKCHRIILCGKGLTLTGLK